MPTVLTQNGFYVRMYLPPREHGPPHVHVRYAGTEVIIALGDATTAPTIVEVHGMGTREVVRAYRIVEANQARLLKAWGLYHD